eukprot:8967385-Karenia_brevis.AAC.1
MDFGFENQDFRIANPDFGVRNPDPAPDPRAQCANGPKGPIVPHPRCTKEGVRPGWRTWGGTNSPGPGTRLYRDICMYRQLHIYPPQR